MEMNEKIPYGAPRLTVVEFAMERGFATSGDGQSTGNTENRQNGGFITGVDEWF